MDVSGSVSTPAKRIAVERLEPRCGGCGSLLPRPKGDPAVGFGFNGLPGSSDRAFIDVRQVALDPIAVACGDCGDDNIARFWREQA